MHENLFCVCPQFTACVNADPPHHAANPEASCQKQVHEGEGGVRTVWYSFALRCGARCRCRPDLEEEERQIEAAAAQGAARGQDEVEEEIEADEVWQLKVSLLVLGGVLAWFNRAKLAPMLGRATAAAGSCGGGGGGGGGGGAAAAGGGRGGGGGLRGGLVVGLARACGAICSLLASLPQTMRNAGEATPSRQQQQQPQQQQQLQMQQQHQQQQMQQPLPPPQPKRQSAVVVPVAEPRTSRAAGAQQPAAEVELEELEELTEWLLSDSDGEAESG